MTRIDMINELVRNPGKRFRFKKGGEGITFCRWKDTLEMDKYGEPSSMQYGLFNTDDDYEEATDVHSLIDILLKTDDVVWDKLVEIIIEKLRARGVKI
jgi:mannitol-1-phosphate/altronate dehydrogenase